MSTDLTYIVRALDEQGNEFYYTGRAGTGWVSSDINDAFNYSKASAQHKAMKFNEVTALHGLWFIALDKSLRNGFRQYRSE